MRVKFSPRALQRARIVTAWWRKNRPGVGAMFEQELDDITGKFITMSPRSPLGTIHAVSRGRIVRRILLPKTEQHVYYSIDDANDTVVIRTIWGARRGRSPKL